ncbi:M48 family metalloprotease, partial [Desulfonatronospira sp. MSAO_Bac3]|uniref:M48 family metalloprotease n=1 Tax=Desulfonatronospira sp. MSAO_Bac3 TaxID=2293857 RepID=UPI000FF28559
NPVTGDRQFMLMSESGEISLDKQHSPHQFSADYGAVQDSGLNNYLDQKGKELASISHRPDMPYSFRCVNATYVNAYAFPGGSIATTRGILLEMQNEAELDALLGHEIAHVNARHTAARMSRTVVTQLLVIGASIYLESQHEEYAPLAAGLGSFATGALLARYSRNDEREADELGMLYMTDAGMNPKGMVGLMDVLVSINNRKPSVMERMFSTHPMSQERYDKALYRSRNEYAHAGNYPVHRERYMDNTAGLRRMKGAIEDMQDGEGDMRQERFSQAEESFNRALKQAPDDYAALVLMSKCQLALNRPRRAKTFSDRATRVYPEEAQAHHINGVAAMDLGQYDEALDGFSHYEEMLPGNPNTVFLKAVCLEGMGRRSDAAVEFERFLQSAGAGDKADYARKRLEEWGYKDSPEDS